MCLNPIRVKNPSRRFQDGLSKTFLEVPCGHCAECQKNAEDDWFVRSFFEWRKIKLSGHGAVWFLLLTYDEDHLPWYEDEELGFRIPCFNPKHIKAFRDSVRTYLTRDGYDASGIKFGIYAEYGKNTGRPHFHCQIYVPFDLPNEYVLGKWKHCSDGKNRLVGGLFDRAWPNGFVSWSVEPGTGRLRPKIESDGGIQYSQKYVNKEDKWTIKESFKP